MFTLRRAAVLFLLALCGWMAASVSRQFSATFDEPAHLTAGYAYWTTGDYRLQPENGNFPQRWAALPLLALPLKFPPATDAGWRQSDVWRVSFDFFHTLGNDPATLLAASRAMIALLGVALAALVFAWSRSLFGNAGGFVSLVLAVFCPNLLAHAGLATSDLAAALAFTAALLAWWRLCHRVTPGRVLLAGGALGLLALAKFSCVLFAPVALLLVAARLLRRAPLVVSFGTRRNDGSGTARPWVELNALRRVGTRRWRLRGFSRALALAGGGLAAVALAVALIWAAYGFRFSIMPPGQPADTRLAFPWDEVLMAQPRASVVGTADGLAPLPPAATAPGPLQAAVRWTRDHQLLPEAWLYGLASVDLFSRQRLEYFAGEYRTTGWVEFFPTAFVLKTTVSALGLLLLAAFVPLLGPRSPRWRLAYRLTPLLGFLAVYWVFALNSHLNIGHRHLLPTYPVLYILLGSVGWAAARAPRGRRWLVAVVALALAGHVGESLCARPYYLAYFNALGGGPAAAHRVFIDSSLDWGQDLPGLQIWLAAHAPGERAFLSYFGSDDPVSAGITATRVADNYFDSRPRAALPVMTGGVWCVSATMLHRAYTHVRGPWSPDYEREYQRLTTWLHQLNTQPPAAPPTDTDGTPLATAELHARLFNLEHLRFGRLCYFLQLRRPDADIGHSILIYRLGDEEISFALFAPLSLLSAAAEAPAAR